MNSYGWDKIYRTDPADIEVDRLLAADIAETTFFKTADFASDGRLYGIGVRLEEGVEYDVVVAVDVSDPLTDWVDQFKIEGEGDYLAFGPQDELWVTFESTLRRVASDGSTVPGTMVNVIYLGGALDIWGIDFDAAGTLYAVDAAHLYRVDPQTGIALRIHSAPDLTGGIFTELDVGADGLIRMLGSNGYLYEYDPISGSGRWLSEQLVYEGATISASSLASGAAETTEPMPARLADFSCDHSTGNAEASIVGPPNTAFRLRMQADLRFGLGSDLALSGASVGSLDGNTVTTDGNGDATVQFNLGMRARMFIRAESE